MKGKVIGYWITTGLSVLGLGVGGFFDFINAPFAQEIMKHLGYPPYMAHLLGVWKIAGLVVIAAPGLARLKEWAYAGFTIDLLSASASHAWTGDGPKERHSSDPVLGGADGLLCAPPAGPRHGATDGRAVRHSALGRWGGVTVSALGRPARAPSRRPPAAAR